jgi:glutaredoxin
MWRLTIYSKPDCCLCDDAKRAIKEFARECNLTLKEIDISKDKVLWEKYCYDIPVLLLDGEEIARHHIGLKKLRVIRQRREASNK